MNESLSQNLNFHVNNYRVVLGKPLDVAGLEANGIQKVGFFARLILRPAKGEQLFIAKNSTFAYLEGKERVITPVVDQKDRKKSHFGTIAYLWYQKNRLSKFGFQIVQSAAFTGFTLFEEFEKGISESLAPPTRSSDNQRVWEIRDQKLVLTLPLQNQYGYIHLMYSE